MLFFFFFAASPSSLSTLGHSIAIVALEPALNLGWFHPFLL